MHTKWLTRMLAVFFLILPPVFACSQKPVGQLEPQATPKPELGPASSGESTGERFIAEAKAADVQGDVLPYAQHLTEIFVSRKTGDAYVRAFSHRLAMADRMARHGKRKWIPESIVAQAFNDLMEQTNGTSDKPLRTDTNTIHQLRTTLAEVSPALSTVKSHSSECLPSEAVSLMTQLLSRNGSLEDPCPPTKPETHGCVQEVNANVLLLQYSQSHSASENVMLFDHVARLFGM